ncbi:sensor histidine kinase [Klugiella xanthotipulae]|uniref:histidine kinase n=1 Tax=Klugiella xanthotipulae TaxID=244735 RepID=A0A543I5R3_9MICO|nr:sensor histidine kinase [Klugiella xanthotipulae]TQM65904.1 signal transduction histidine kinase [Klugiella xanthotipulae]
MESKRGWTLALLVSCLVLLGLALATTASGGTDRLSEGATLGLSIAGILAIPVYVVVSGWRAITSHNGTWPPQLILIAIGALLTFLNPNMFTVQVIMYPLLWSTSRTTRQAITLNVVAATALGSTAAIGMNEPFWSPSVWGIAGASLIFSLGMGLWITSIHRYGEENARLLADLTRQQDTIAALNRETGAVEERARLSRDLHDTIAQTLTGVVMLSRRARTLAAGVNRPETSSDPRTDTVALLDTLNLIESSAVAALADTRVMVATMSSSPAGGSLSDALHRLCDRFGHETGVDVRLTLTAHTVTELPRPHEVVLLRCVQEALANVRKHAAASRVTVHLGETPDGPVLTVTDNGRGASSATTPGRAAGGQFGIDGMRDRLALVGGTVTLDFPAGGGARLTVTLPGAAPRTEGASA